MKEFYFLFVCFFISYANAQCQTRNLTLAREVGRPCRRSCDPEQSVCRGGKLCLCDHECGYSCINTENQCPTPPAISNFAGVEVFRRNSTGLLEKVTSPPYRYNDVAHYQCRPGYRKNLPILAHYCHGRKGWTGQSQCIASCRPYNSRNVARERLVCGGSCRVDTDCQSGQRCVCDGHCGRSCVGRNVDCGAAPRTPNVIIQYEGKGFGRTAYYSCARGYYARFGDRARKCTGGGRWSGSTLSCQRIECGDLLEALRQSGGRISWRSSNRNLINTRVQIECPPRHELIGGRNRTCLPTGQWGGPPSACDHIDQNLRCPHPGTPVNGRLLQGRNFSVGAVVTFRCNRGYVMVGDKRQECLYFLQWSGNGAPKCINALHPSDFDQAFDRLQQANSSIQVFLNPVSPGNSISDEISSDVDIFFVFDLAEDNKDEMLKQSIVFAKDRIQVMSRNGMLRCSIIFFATSVKTLLPMQSYSELTLRENLDNILLDRATIAEEIGWRRSTTAVLTSLDVTISTMRRFDEKRDVIAFLLINGRHSVGDSPGRTSNKLKRKHGSYTQVFVVTYGGGLGFGSTYNELQKVAIPTKLFLPNPNVSQLKKFESKKSKKNKCGFSGDVGDIKHQFLVGKVIGGNAARPGAWPWHGIVSLKNRNVFETFRQLKGGASLINRKWALTAAHIFRHFSKFKGWERTVMIIFGINHIPQSQNEKLPIQTQAYDADDVIIHSNFNKDTFDYDVALIKTGRRFEQHGRYWEQILGASLILFSDHVRPICVPCLSECVRVQLIKEGLLSGNESLEQRCRIEETWLLQTNNQKLVKNAVFAVTGFGSNVSHTIHDRVRISKKLKQGLIQLVNSERCENGRQAMIKRGLPQRIRYTPRMVCGISGDRGNADACKGDSGGAIVREIYNHQSGESCWVQAGVVSWGWGCGQTYDNGKQYPGFYASLAPVMPWLISKAQTNDRERCRRNSTMVEAGRSCRKSCTSDSDCKATRKICICDDMCGLSCINPQSRCVALPALLNGRIRGLQTYGNNVTYSCNAGYKLVGNSSRKCRSDKMWSGSSPICVLEAKPMCTMPRNLRSVRKQVPVGSVVTYSCDERFTLKGHQSNHINVTCQGSGTWSNSPPVCRGFGCTIDNGICQLPFVYKGTHYYSCTTQDEPSGRPWCSKTPTLTKYFGQCKNCDITANFRINYPGITDRCGSTLIATASDQSLSLANFPSNYENNFNCHWIIRPANKENQVQITLTALITERCCDYLKVCDGPYKNGGTASSISGYLTTPFGFTSTFGVLSVWFWSDESINFSGFHLTYRERRFARCGEELQATTRPKTFATPGWPGNYTNNVHCIWTIRAPPGLQVKVDFSEVHTEACCDTLLVRDGNQVNSTNTVNAKGSFAILNDIISSEGVISVVFWSDEFINHRGFTASYYTVATSSSIVGRPNPVCSGRRLAAPLVGFGNFSLPPAPSTGIEEFRCVWTVFAPAGRQVRVWVSFMNFKNAFFLVRDGQFSNSRKIGSIKHRPNFFVSYVSTGRALRVEVFGFPIKVNDTFFAFYEVHIPGADQRTSTCGGRLSATPSLQFISSPNWPNFYNANSTCSWTLTAPSGRYVHLYFLGILTNHTADQIEVFFGSTPTAAYTITGRFNQRFVLTSERNVLRVVLRTGPQRQYAGFKAAYKSSRERPWNLHFIP